MRVRFSGQAMVGLTMACVAAVPTAIFLALPALGALGLSFTNFTLFLTHIRFIGLANYRELLHDPIFKTALRNTLQYVAETVPFTLALAFGFALLVNRPMPGISFFRTAYYLPTVSSLVSVGVIWTAMFDPYTGIIGHITQLFGFTPTNWLQDPSLAMQALVIVTAWKGFGLGMLIYLAGLHSLPESYFEAARIDGANRFQTVRYITWPLLRPVTFYLIITGVISSFQAFDLIVVMTGGGPLNSTTTLVHQVYLNAFVYNRLGFASATAFVLFAIILVFTVINVKAFSRDIEYS